jgi:epoxyqueuosine reductase
LVEDAKTVISLLFNYYTDQQQSDPEAPKISKYAYGEDYHHVIKDKLNELIACIQDEIGAVHGRGFVDSAPVMDKAWAKKAGLGWIGKNSNLIHPKKGSFFFIADLILDLKIEADGPIKDYCGTCTKCIDACPTDAIIEPYVVNGSKCISYLTIELKDELLPKEFEGKMDNWMFGCDICQDVCPWNRFSVLHNEERFIPHPDLLDLKKQNWIDLQEEGFQILFQRSPVKRTKYKGLKRNITFLKTS